MEYLFKIFRYDPQKDEKPYFQDFISQPGPMDSILEAMMVIRNTQAPDLSFRYSCREAVCGSCGMVINGNITLACKTTLRSLDSQTIVIEPLPTLELQKDLIVDMDPFFKAMESIQPYLMTEGDPPEKGHRMSEKELDRIFQFVTCIWCGCCYTSCPVVGRDERYLGPAAMAKLYRFVKDPRDNRPRKFWKDINTETGMWGCDTVFKCNEVCPKDVRPADGIIGLRREFIKDRLRGFFRREK